jgi:hypothetical protein
MGQLGREPSAQPAGELFGRGVRKAGEDDLFELVGLPGNGGGDARICVAMEVYPPGRDGVDDAAAIFENERSAFAAGNPERRKIVRGVRERMPDAEGRLERPPRSHRGNAVRSK